MQLIKAKELSLYCSDLPQPYARTISPFDIPEIKKDKKSFPFKQKKHIDFEVNYKGKRYEFLFYAYRNDIEGFKYNGANIPKGVWWLMGSNANPDYLIPSYFHDVICNHKELLGYDRYLSSLIFKELLLANGINKFQAGLMFHLVDNYQKLQKWG